MCNTEKIRRLVFSMAVMLLVAIAGISVFDSLCIERYLGIRVLDEKTLENAEYVYKDYSNDILMNRERAAIDIKSSTIYISQRAEDMSEWNAGCGKLSVSEPLLKAFFVKDKSFDNMEKAVEDGHIFKLVIMKYNRQYMLYNVVFTTLPVLRLTAEQYGVGDFGWTEVSGNMCLWTQSGFGSDNYSAVTSNLRWHVRGGSTFTSSKKSLKLSLSYANGQKRNVSLLDMGSDDDWILNAMSMEDLKVREKLTMDIWNQIIAADNSQDKPMSTGEYVELVSEGVYCGVYLLQRRVDKKYLELNPNDILLKGKNVWVADSLEEGYDIIYSRWTAGETYDYLRSIRFGEDMSMINISNFIDVNILLQLGSMPDNVGYKNMFYLLKKENGERTLCFVPWDTDMSFGVTYTTGWACDYDYSLDFEAQRTEYAEVNSLYPDLGSRCSDRWAELRETKLTNENVLQLYYNCRETLVKSGALEREYAINGKRFGNQDSWELLEHFIEERLAWLDNYYQN